MSFNSRLTDLLKKDPRFVDDEGELLIAAVQDRAWKIDRDLVKLLLSDKEIKTKFFDEIAAHWVFNLNTFIEYISQKNFLDNSYTRFRNRIGLTVGDKYLRERGDVALAWPYKDCLLEGGQTKEEEKRREIFFNEMLAEDEINRLLAPKVLSSFVRYTAKGKQPVKEFKRDEKGIIRDNLVIKGNNLLALHGLKTLFRGQIRLIYLDPPYNSGSDSFGYNDNFNRAAWLTFMKNRLEIARELLSHDGAVIVQISDRQVGYLHVLMEDVFPDGFINKVAVKTRSPSGFKTVNQGVFESAEYLLIYGKVRRSWMYNPQFEATDYDENYCFQVSNYRAPVSKWRIENIKDIVASNHGFKNPREAKKSLGKAVFLAELAQYAIENAKSVFRYTEINTDAGKETLELKALSLKKPAKVFVLERKGLDTRLIMNGQELTFYANKVRDLDGEKGPTIMLTNIWTDIAWEGIAAEGGVKLKKGKKPERLLRRLIAMGTSKNTDIVLQLR
jgi:adenine-specific DNA-methyltransferase